jgi:hypothetical protein
VNKTIDNNNANGNALIKITLDRKLSELEIAILLALDDVAKANDEYRDDSDSLMPFIPMFSTFHNDGKFNIYDDDDHKTLNEYRVWIKRSSTHCFSLDDLRERLASDTSSAALTIDGIRNAVQDMITLSINKTLKDGKDDYDCLYKIFDSISVDKDDGKGYFSFSKTFGSILKRSKAKSFGQTIVSLKRKSDLER